MKCMLRPYDDACAIAGHFIDYHSYMGYPIFSESLLLETYAIPTKETTTSYGMDRLHVYALHFSVKSYL